MIPIGEWWRRVWYLLNRARFDEDLRQEMEEHRSSMGDPSRFGNALRLREDARDAWGWRWLAWCRVKTGSSPVPGSWQHC